MSKTIDQSVVEFRFDNSQFERETKRSQNTLNRLRESLKLTEASKGLDNVSKAVKNVDVGVLGRSADMVSARFSAMQVMGVTALANITNSAVNAGKRMVRALTITPVSTGFNEYELKMGSIQTIMASTGESLETVNKYLDELNEYSDKTIYSFQDMTSNIGKFTNAGVKLEDAVLAMKGISNEAAVSGANANEASRAMYNFAQALSAGYVKLIDWKSIELANMATVEFKEQLIATAVAAGTLTKTSDGLYKTLEGTVISATKNFNDSLQDEWMTSEVLIETLKDYADETTEIGKKATEAATEVKTFTQMMDALKESAQSGWAKTWEIIFGDFEEGKTLWTGINKVVDGFLGRISDARNNFLESALGKSSGGSGWDRLIDKIEEAGVSVEDFSDVLKKTAKENGIDIDKLIEKHGSLAKAISKVKDPAKLISDTLKKLAGNTRDASKSTEDITSKLEKFQSIVNKVIRGDLGDGEKRIKALTEAGYEHTKVQELVNYIWERNSETWKDVSITSEELVKVIGELSDEELKNIGYTEEEVKKLKELADQAEKTGTPISKLIEDLSTEKPTGRQLLIETFANVVEAISKPLTIFKDTFRETFGDVITPDGLYKAIEGIRDFTASLQMSEDAAKDFKTVCEGIFAVWQIINSQFSASMPFVIKVADALAQAFDINLMDVAVKIAEVAISIRDWVDENTIFINSVSKVAAILESLIRGIDKIVDALMGMDSVKRFLKELTGQFVKFFDAIGLGIDGVNFESFIKLLDGLFDKLAKLIDKFDDSEFFNAGLDIVLGLTNGILEGISGAVSAILKLGNTLINKFCELLGIHSPSKVFIAIGGFIISGLIVGLLSDAGALADAIKQTILNIYNIALDTLQNGLPFVINVVKTIGTKMYEALQTVDIDFGKLYIAGVILALMYMFKKFTDVLEKFSTPFESVGKGIKNFLDSFADVNKAKALNMKTDAILNIAKAVGILAASFYVLAQLEWEEIGKGAVAMAAVAGSLLILTAAANKIEDASFVRLGIFMFSFATATLILAGAMKVLSTIYWSDALSAIASLAAIVGGMATVLYIFGKTIDNPEVAKRIGSAGKLFTKMAVAVIIMAAAIKLMAGIPMSDVSKSILILTGITGIFGVMLLLSSVAGDAAGAGKMILKMSIALALIPIVIKMIAGIPNSDIVKGGIVIVGVMALFAGVIFVSKFAGQHASKAGTMLLKMSVAIGILAMVMKLMATISYEDILKSLNCIAEIEKLFAAFIAVSWFAGDNGNKAGSMILKMAAGMAAMALAIKLLGSIPLSDIVKGLAVIAAIETLFGVMVFITKNTGANADKAGTMMLKMSLAIVVLAGAIALLSFLDPQDVAVGTAAISALLGMFALVAKSASNVADSMKTMIVIAVTIGLLVGAIIALTFIPPNKVITAAAAISGVLAAFSLLVYASKFANQTTNMKKGIIGLTAMVIPLSAFALALNYLPTNNIAGKKDAIIALSQIMVVMTGLMLAVSSIGALSSKMGGGMAKGIAGLTAMLAEFSLFALALNKIPMGNIAKNKEAIILLTGVMTVMSALLLVTSAVGAIYALTGGIAATGLLGLVGMLASFSLFALALNAIPMDNIAKNKDTILMLTDIMTVLADLLVQVSILGPLTVVGVASMTTLTILMTAIGVLATEIGWLMDKFPSIETFLNTGLPMLEKLADSLGSMLGKFVDGFLTEASANLPDIGSKLGMFMTNAMPFITGAKLVDDAVLKGVAILTGAIIALTAADFVSGIASFFSFGSSFSMLGLELAAFMYNAKPFIDSMKAMDPAVLEGVKILSEAILSLTAASLLEGITRFLPMSSSLTQFGDSLPKLGTGLRGFVDNLGPFTEEQVTTVKCATDAIKALSNAAQNMDGQSEWAKKLFGDNSLGAFASQLPFTAWALKGFVTNLGTFTEDQVTTVKCAGDAIVKLAEAGSKIEGTGGFFDKLFGDDSIYTFATQLPGTATALKGFVTNLGTFSEEQVATVKCAGNAIASLAKAGSNIDGQSEWAKKLFGDNGLAKFSGELPTLGTNLKSFITNLGSFGEEQIATVNAAVGVVKALAKLGNSDIKGMISNLPSFGDKMILFADDLVSFCNKLSDIDSTAVSAITNNLVNAIKDAGQKISDQKTNFETAGSDLLSSLRKGIDSEKSETKTTCENLITDLKKAITKKKDDFKTAGEDLIKSLAKGIETKDKDVKSAVETLLDSAISAIEEYEDDFKSTGKDLGQGLINGIEAKETAAYNAGYALGAKAAQGVKDGEDSNSPSKKGIKAGKDLGRGLVIGIQQMGRTVYNTGYNMGDIAVRSLSKTISKLSEAIDTDIDSQPTIRPVLDLSDVTAGANTIGDLLNNNPSIGVNANVGAITTMMNRRIQNGGNDDVISAIKDLGRDMSNISSNSYTINGVTYSDGSEVSEAIQVLTRALKLEGRV